MEKTKSCKRKYIDELGISYFETPQGYNMDIEDDRKKYWESERLEYGFDERETWGLNYTIDLLLYERLCMYKEVASKVIDLTFHEFEYKGETLTQIQCIDKMIEGLKLDLTLDEYAKERENPSIKEKINDVYNIYALCKNALWW